METDKPPVACSLEPVEIDSRGRQWKELLAANLVDREVIPGGVRLRLQPSDDMGAKLSRLIELESNCCAWIEWSIEEGRLVQVEATAGSHEGASVLVEWFGPATEVPG